MLPFLFTPFVQRTPFVHRNEYAGGSHVAAAWVQLYRALTKRTTSSMSLKRAMGAMGPNTSSCATPLPVGVLRCLGDAACDAEISHSTPTPKNVRHARHSKASQGGSYSWSHCRPTDPTDLHHSGTAERRQIGLEVENRRLNISEAEKSSTFHSRNKSIKIQRKPSRSGLPVAALVLPTSNHVLLALVDHTAQSLVPDGAPMVHRVSLEVAAPSRGEPQQRDEALNLVRIRLGRRTDWPDLTV